MARAKKQRKPFLKNWRTELRNYILAGLLIIVPLGVTIFALRFIIRLADSTLRLLPESYRPETYLPFHVPGLGIILSFALLLIIGFLVRNFIGQRLVRLGEKIIEHIPLVRSIYSGAKQLTLSIFTASDQQFSRVVIIEYPRKGLYSLAFVTSQNTGHLRWLIGKPCISVFVPTTPNPTSGYYLIVPLSEVVDTDLTVEEAFRIIISAGMSPPVRNAKAPAETAGED